MPLAARPSGISLEYKLPILITGLLLTLVVVGSILAYREVRGSALMAGEERLSRVSRQLADLVAAASTGERVQLLKEVARQPAVAALLAGGGDAELVRPSLEALSEPADSGLPVEVWDRDRDLVLQVGPLTLDGRPAELEGRHRSVVIPDSGGFGEFLALGGRGHVWAAAPVVRRGETLGWVAQLRRIGGGNTSDQIEELIGARATVYFANLAGGPWVALAGDVVDAPVPRPGSGPAEYGRDGESYMSVATPVDGVPFAVVVEAPTAEILERPSMFLKRLLAAALLLTILGAVGAWVVSRSITVPLRELGGASADIAAGDYSRRVAVDRGDELGDLAKAFSTMAEEVESAHEALRHQYEEARAARRDAETASRAKSDFLATMSHEIRTPINAIIGYTDLLQLGIAGTLTDTQKAQLERIRVSGQHLITLVDDVLDLSRVESGGLKLSKRVGRSGDILDAAVAVLAPEAERKGIRLERLDGGGDVLYRGDPQRVKQIVINLLSNAVKFTEPGGRVEVGAERRRDDGRDGWAIVSVRDNGIGIPADQVERIFEPFVQVDRGYTRSYGGVGLGLAICRRLARMMGGDVEVESTPGEGSRFVLRLPLVEDRDAVA